ncbi:salt tolerance down-regulator-domain-containing protein [Zopfochytrium polystomum]|nr:salt tolerance down-regulator-domain-containing protein [Zopfochytrium polystomum]
MPPSSNRPRSPASAAAAAAAAAAGASARPQTPPHHSHSSHSHSHHHHSHAVHSHTRHSHHHPPAANGSASHPHLPHQLSSQHHPSSSSSNRHPASASSPASRDPAPPYRSPSPTESPRGGGGRDPSDGGNSSSDDHRRHGATTSGVTGLTDAATIAEAIKRSKKKKKKGGLATARNGSIDSSAGGDPGDRGSIGSRNNNSSSTNSSNVQSARANAKTSGNIWYTSDMEEKQRIREFWMDLKEDERRALVKLEKEAVLKKMKEQQRQSCSCSVCGKKRSLIEHELEMLYDAYYDELESFTNGLARTGRARIRSSGGSDGDLDDDSESIDSQIPAMAEFGSSLTAKGGILTVADDFLKNDGKKFLDLMEQLADRKIQLLEDEEAADEFYDGPDNEWEDEEDDEGDYDDEYDDEDVMTEDQRLEERRRMFQIFAARMFEQRVLTAYREKVAQDRAEKLLQELDEERVKEVQQEEARRNKNMKKKAQKKALKQQKEEEKLEREKERLEEEERLRQEREKKAEEERIRKEMERQKREEERQRKEELERQRREQEKARKEEERLKREEAERVKREAERARKEEEKKRQREAEEKRQREAEERRQRAREERERLERERQQKTALLAAGKAAEKAAAQAAVQAAVEKAAAAASQAALAAQATLATQAAPAAQGAGRGLPATAHRPDRRASANSSSVATSATAPSAPAQGDLSRQPRVPSPRSETTAPKEAGESKSFGITPTIKPQSLPPTEARQQLFPPSQNPPLLSPTKQFIPSNHSAQLQGRLPLPLGVSPIAMGTAPMQPSEIMQEPMISPPLTTPPPRTPVEPHGPPHTAEVPNTSGSAVDGGVSILAENILSALTSGSGAFLVPPVPRNSFSWSAGANFPASAAAPHLSAPPVGPIGASASPAPRLKPIGAERLATLKKSSSGFFGNPPHAAGTIHFGPSGPIGSPRVDPGVVGIGGQLSPSAGLAAGTMDRLPARPSVAPSNGGGMPGDGDVAPDQEFDQLLEQISLHVGTGSEMGGVPSAMAATTSPTAGGTASNPVSVLNSASSNGRLPHHVLAQVGATPPFGRHHSLGAPTAPPGIAAAPIVQPQTLLGGPHNPYMLAQHHHMSLPPPPPPPFGAVAGGVGVGGIGVVGAGRGPGIIGQGIIGASTQYVPGPIPTASRASWMGPM